MPRTYHEPLVDLDCLVGRSRDGVLMGVLETAKWERLLERRWNDLGLKPLQTRNTCGDRTEIRQR